MQLDYNPSTSSFIVRVPRGSPEVRVLMQEHGLDFSKSASTTREAVLFTKEPYAAVAFADHATPRALVPLKSILSEIELSWKPESGAHIACPPDQELWGFQKADIEYALRRTNTLVGDQPGLGKTPIAICYANEIRAKRVLVVCPAAIRTQWAEKIRVWSTMKWPYHVHCIYTSKSGVNPYAQWTVTSYELARTPAIARALASGRYDLLILDEGHYLKTIDTRRTRAIFGGGAQSDFQPLATTTGAILALTGTPLPNRPREAYTLARGLCFDAIDWLSEEKFNERFNPSAKGVTDSGKIYIDERTGRHAELQARLRANFMTRHLKRDVMKQLKLPVYDLIVLDEDKAIKQALEAESLLGIDPENLDPHIEVLGEIATVRRLMGVAMAPQIADYIDMLIDGGEDKLVVFAWHHEVMTILLERWRKHGVCLWKPGATSHNETMKQRFMRDPSMKIALGNTLTLGTGTDGLQEVCYHALIAEPDWTPGNNIQCFDRLDRGGQRNQVQGDIFVAPGSIAEKVLGMALRKLQTNHKALDRRGWK